MLNCGKEKGANLKQCRKLKAKMWALFLPKNVAF